MVGRPPTGGRRAVPGVPDAWLGAGSRAEPGAAADRGGMLLFQDP